VSCSLLAKVSNFIYMLATGWDITFQILTLYLCRICN